MSSRQKINTDRGRVTSRDSKGFKEDFRRNKVHSDENRQTRIQASHDSRVIQTIQKFETGSASRYSSTKTPITITGESRTRETDKKPTDYSVTRRTRSSSQNPLGHYSKSGILSNTSDNMGSQIMRYLCSKKHEIESQSRGSPTESDSNDSDRYVCQRSLQNTGVDERGLNAVVGTSPSVDRSGRASRASNRNTSNGDRIRSASQGLRNLGNTCYMNSVLQCLAKVPWKGISNYNDQFLNEFFGLMNQLQNYKSEEPINPTKFRKQISVLGFRFSKSDQNDAHEFLVCLLGRLRKNLDSEHGSGENIVKNLFLGEQQNIIDFQTCKHVLPNKQSFFTISLPIILDNRNNWSSDTIKLTDCLERYTRIDSLDGEALCLECQRMQPATIKTDFTILPTILILHLKRYEFQTMTKLDTRVIFPVNNLSVKEKGITVYYDLFGVCHHSGTLRFGHYTADIKSPTGKWHSYSDSSVSQTFGLDSSLPSSSTAYIFFYSRRATDMPTDETNGTSQTPGYQGSGYRSRRADLNDLQKPARKETFL